MKRKYHGTTSDPYDEYGYNLQNRLTSFTPNGASSIVYTYNPDGIRIQKQVGTSSPISYLVDSFNPTGYTQVLKESADSNMIYVLGNDIIAQAGSADVQYFLYDGHGSVRQLADNTGAIISGQNFNYDAYGNLLGSPSPQTNLLYTGEMYDSALEMYYLRARYYDPSAGRFNATDPFAGDNQDPQSFHKYLYVYCDPINNYDPTGFFTQAFGYLAEASIQYIYKIDHPFDNVSYGGWTRFGSPLDKVFRMKPDIINFTKSTWLEIKPLTLSGVAKAGTQFTLYLTALKPFGYKPEIGWTPSTHFTIAGNQEIFFFNAGGIVFYTDLYDSAEDLLALTSYEAVKAFMRSPAGLRMGQSLLGVLSRVPGLVSARVKIDDTRLQGHFNIGFLFAGLGVL